jgi:hypothetical protein
VPGKGVASPHTSHTVCWQPVHHGNRSAQHINQQCKRNSSKPKICHAIRQNQSPVSLWTPEAPGKGVASPYRSHTVCWQPVLCLNRPQQETNHQHNRNTCKTVSHSQTGVDTSVPVDPRSARKGCGQPTYIPHSVLAACAPWV